MPPYVFKPKTENKNTLNKNLASMSLYVLKPKIENKNISQDYMIGTGKNVKVVYKLKTKNQHKKSKFFTFLFEGIYSV